jgi:hypothetical protein
MLGYPPKAQNPRSDKMMHSRMLLPGVVERYKAKLKAEAKPALAQE